MIKHSALAMLITATTLVAQSDFKERLAEFIQSPPPIREMVVECNWYAHPSIGTTNTQWIVLCWQTNAYILRTSNQRVGLYDTFDTNREDEISIRAGDTYSAVSYYKVLGVHIRKVQGLQKPGERDMVTPMLLSHLDSISIVLTAGVPLGPPGKVVRSGDTFTYRKESDGGTFSAFMHVDSSNVVRGFEWTGEPAQVGMDGKGALHGPIRYTYGGTSQPAWFPHEIERDLVVGDVRFTMCRMVVHRLQLGPVPMAEFVPERFLPGPPVGKVETSNGLSYVTLKGVTKPVMDPKDLRARGVQLDVRPHRAVYAALAVAFALGTLALGVAARRAPKNR